MKGVYRISNGLIILLATFTIAVSATDLGFFKYYNSRITNAVFDWSDDIGLMLKIMLSNSTYLPYFLAFIVMVLVYIFLQKRIVSFVIARPHRRMQLFQRIVIFLAVLALVFFGIRGTFNLNHRPLNSDDAYFSENPFLNQLSFNPVFSFVNSYNQTQIHYFKSDEEAITRALHYLDRKRSQSENPFEVYQNGTDSIHPNIIFFFLESMSNAMVSRYHPGQNTTPFFDSIAEQGIVFDNFFSAGIHTYNGIFSSLYGLPAIMHNKPMNSVETANNLFHGLPNILKERKYENYFFVTGDKTFDNMNGFLIPNGFDRIISESDYPASNIKDGWGITDEIMFNRVIEECDALYKQDKKFFINILTISTHEGYSIPDAYSGILSNKDYPEKRYEFLDILLREFMHTAKTKDWFEHTVFIFVGDHGQNFSPVYDMSLNYHKIPLIIYAPRYFNHFAYKHIGLQQDIYPTVCGLLDFGFVNNSLGVDLFRHQRKYGYFSSDNKLGVIDSTHYLIYRSENNISMYNYRSNSLTDVYEGNTVIADSMKDYAFSMLQSAQFLINNDLSNSPTK